MRKEQVSTLADYLRKVGGLLRKMGILTSLEISDRRVPPGTLDQIVEEGEVHKIDERNLGTTRRN